MPPGRPPAASASARQGANVNSAGWRWAVEWPLRLALLEPPHPNFVPASSDFSGIPIVRSASIRRSQRDKTFRLELSL